MTDIIPFSISGLVLQMFGVCAFSDATYLRKMRMVAKFRRKPVTHISNRWRDDIYHL